MKAYASDSKKTNPVSLLSEASHKGEEWKLVQNIIATPPFLRSDFLTNFLIYICDRKLRGRANEITEHQIGVHALGRPPAYNQGEDNIVRNYARMLRKRLEEYFAGEGHEEILRIVIPRGQYVPVFEANLLPDAMVSSAPGEHAAEISGFPIAVVPSRRSFFPTKRSITAVIIAVCLAGGWLYRTDHAQPENLYGLFWHGIFDSEHTTYIVTADSGISLLEDMTGREVHLPEYVSGDLDKYFPDFDELKRSDGKSFDADRLANLTSLADLNAVAGILRLPKISAGHAVVRNARDMHMNDFLQSNVILLGGPHANPWVEIFEPASEFLIEFSTRLDERAIINKHPRPNEQSEYRNVADSDPHLTYTILSFLPSNDSTRDALLIQGLNMAGTQAGANFILNRNAMIPILEKARLKDGRIGRFEVVLETQAVGASAPEARPIIERYGQPPYYKAEGAESSSHQNASPLRKSRSRD